MSRILQEFSQQSSIASFFFPPVPSAKMGSPESVMIGKRILVDNYLPTSRNELKLANEELAPICRGLLVGELKLISLALINLF